MKHNFDEARVSKARDPVDARDVDFDWDRLCDALDEEAPQPRTDKLLEELIVRVLQLLVPARRGRLFPRSLGLRLLALAWVLNPGFFDDNPSLRRLARRANVTPAKFARHTGEFSRLLRWRNRAQRHAWNWIKGQRSPFE